MMSCVYLLFFFFFKQKTAYELRISDWSSDVCSSDLSARSLAIVCATADQRISKHTCSANRNAPSAMRNAPTAPMPAPSMPEIDVPHVPPDSETGRASCRARERPSDQIPVVAVSLKNN